MPEYQRVLLKISGEALAGDAGFGIDIKVIEYLAEEIKPLIDQKIQLGLVVGGGNMFRGAKLKEFDRVDADYMGMLATVINALAVRDVFEKQGLKTSIMSALEIPGVVRKFRHRDALESMQEGKVVIFCGGTGNPLVTTDSALALRGIELKADLLLKATNVDGVYSADPKQNPEAKMFTTLTYDEALNKELRVMDLVAFSLCRDHNMHLRVFNLHKPGALLRIAHGYEVGTYISNQS